MTISSLKRLFQRICRNLQQNKYQFEIGEFHCYVFPLKNTRTYYGRSPQHYDLGQSIFSVAKQNFKE